MSISERGAWWVDGGSYRKGQEGSLGEDVDVQADTLGWTLRSIKYELAFNGFQGGMILDSPLIGDAADKSIKAFQTARKLVVDGKAGQRTLAKLLEKRCNAAEAKYVLEPDICLKMVGHESSFDPGAIGYADYLDRGCTQKHLYPGGSVNLSQAIRPAVAIPRLAAQLARVRDLFDLDTAVASWNVGEGGAAWWFEAGKPGHGSPSWWTAGDLSARIVAYLEAVRNVNIT
jgi:soluble lytic murein transglycosylase-like protein